MNLKVNLLPEAKLSKARNKARRRKYTTITILVGVIVGVICVLLIMLRIYLVGTYAAGQTKVNQLNTEINKFKDLEESASTLQQNLASFYQLNTNRTHASRIIKNFFNALPNNINISSISVNEKGTVSVTGTTASFADVSKFASSLEQYNLDYLPQQDLDRKAVFSNVAITTVSKNEGVTSFSMTFTVNEDVLKNQRKQ